MPFSMRRYELTTFRNRKKIPDLYDHQNHFVLLPRFRVHQVIFTALFGICLLRETFKWWQYIRYRRSLLLRFVAYFVVDTYMYVFFP